MNKTLTLVRHAKSSWENSSISDFDRPLNHRGLKNAPDMAKRLAEKQIMPDLIVSSPALRAITTAKIIAQEINYPESKIIKEHSIYEASLNTLLTLVSSFDDAYDSIMMFGHNPGFTYLCNYLSNANIDNLKTCSVSNLQFSIHSWVEIEENAGELLDYDYPRKEH